VTARIRSDVAELYARQSQAIDDGDAEGWARTFTADGVFVSPTHGEPVRGFEALRRFAAAVRAGHAAQGIQERHWLNSVVADVADGLVRTRAYLMIVRIGPGGRPELARHVVIRDELVDQGGLLVRQRRVSVDPGPATA
jgi:hypothetical protein